MLVKCKECIYYSKPYKTTIIKRKHKGKYYRVGLFGKQWVKGEGYDETRTKVSVPGKCKRYPKHMITDPEHECGEGMIIDDRDCPQEREDIEIYEVDNE